MYQHNNTGAVVDEMSTPQYGTNSICQGSPHPLNPQHLQLSLPSNLYRQISEISGTMLGLCVFLMRFLAN
jgi:hypothetical protein